MVPEVGGKNVNVTKPREKRVSRRQQSTMKIPI